MASLDPSIIVLALGAGALGGPEALRLLLAFSGQSPVADIATCVFLIGMFTAHLLGAAILARFVRKARARAGGARGGAPAAAATDCFAKMTLAVSVGVTILATACLVVVPFVASGTLGPAHLLVAVLGVCAAASTKFSCIMPLFRVFGEAGNPDGAVPAARTAERFADAARLLQLTGVRLVAVSLLVVSFVAPGGLGALRLFRSYTNMFVGVAAATVVGTTLIVRASRRPRNAAGAGGAATPTPTTDTRRFAKPTCLAVVSFTVACVIAAISYAYSSAGRQSDGGTHRCSV
ncbi:hypothetical protein ACP70R_042478 [Stipagrostis hirtigluma subsp. patula]